MNENSFYEKVWAACKKIPLGRITTYKIIANAMGSNACRAVGNALNKNPYSPVVPCHRVVKSNGELGGYAKGKTEKIKLLESEGIIIKNNKIIDFTKHLYKF